MLPVFLAVARTTDSGPAPGTCDGAMSGSWCGRLEDARFFWREDRKRTSGLPLEGTGARLVFHAKIGQLRTTRRRRMQVPGSPHRRRSWASERGVIPAEHCAAGGAALPRTTWSPERSGSFPSCRARSAACCSRPRAADRGGRAAAVYGALPARRPRRPELPEDDVGRRRLAGGQARHAWPGWSAPARFPTGSRDPFGLRRAGSGIFRIDHRATAGRSRCATLAEAGRGCRRDPASSSCSSGCSQLLRESGLHDQRGAGGAAAARSASRRGVRSGSCPTSSARLDAIRTEMREREDFAQLVDLTEAGGQHPGQERATCSRRRWPGGRTGRSSTETEQAAALALNGRSSRVRGSHRAVRRQAATTATDHRRCSAGFVDPVERFFSGRARDRPGDRSRRDLAAG